VGFLKILYTSGAVRGVSASFVKDSRVVEGAQPSFSEHAVDWINVKLCYRLMTFIRK